MTFIEEDLIDLNHFEIQDRILIDVIESYGKKFYKIINLDNNKNYLAKISSTSIEYFNRDEQIAFFREIDIYSRLNHPTILKYFGYSLTNFKNKQKPTIIMEYPSNITLENFISPKYNDSDFLYKLNDTKKLINIYGIASAMSYLHSHNIIHRGLCPESIFLDEKLYPKVSGFTFSIELPDSNSIIESQYNINTKYLSPESKNHLKFSKSSDVYSFSILIHEIMSYIPDSSIDECYQNLIQRCSAENPEERPTFEEIVDEIKTNSDFITSKVNADEFHNYIKCIDISIISYSEGKKRKKIEELLNLKINAFDSTKINPKISGPLYDGGYIDLTDYKLNSIVYIQDKHDAYETYCITYKKYNKLTYEEKLHLYSSRSDEKKNDMYKRILEKTFYAQVYYKEINDFYQHEIINFSRKLSILSQINHPCILNFIGYSPIDYSEIRKPIIITEFSDNLLYFPTNSTFKLISIYGIASAMAYLHSHGIIHRDLKSENVYIDYNKIPKLCGFEIAIEIGKEQNIKSDKIKGTPAYLAPEIYLYKEYSKSSDVYSFGFFIYQKLTDQIPFNNIRDPNEMKRKICDEKARPSLDIPIFDSYKDLIERCWSSNPKERPTFDEILHELRTNPKFITAEVDRKQYFEFIEYLDEYPATFDSSKRIDDFDDLISSKLHTFKEFKTCFTLNSMHETETNDLSFEYNYLDLINFQSSNISNGIFYRLELLSNSDSKEQFVAKSLESSLEDYSKSEIKNFVREIKIVSQLNHPSIMKYIGLSQIDDLSGIPAIIVEYLPNGSYYSYKKKINDISDESKEEVIKWTETKKLIYFFGISAGMTYLHSHNIIHRDLKPKNIFLDDSLHPKISGFNISKYIGNESFSKSNKLKGTPAYLAPEVYSKHEYSKWSDVYSFGLIMYEIILEEKPFSKFFSPKEVKEIICDKQERPKFLKPINDSYRRLIEQCWSQNPEDRPSFEYIANELKMNTEFITDQIDKEEYFNYIKSIEESPISYKKSDINPYFEDYISNKIIDLAEYNFKNIFFRIYQTNLDSILLNTDFLDIQKYRKQKMIQDNMNYKLYTIIDKQNEKVYLAKKMRYKIKKLFFKDRNQFYNEINFFYEINHPSFLKFIGYSPFDFKNRKRSIIVTEYGTNGSLENILDIDMKNPKKMILDYTKRLIIIYGIAAGMAYLHSHKKIHCALEPSNIYLDDFLFPKIYNLSKAITLSKNQIRTLTEINFSSLNYDNVYHPPEYCILYDQFPESDVYSFSLIAYQLITNEKPFEKVNYDTIEQICTNNLRPKFSDSVPESYRKLIEKCWATDPAKRPTFDEIVYHLKTDPEFITENVNKEEFESYVNFMDKAQTCNNSKQIDDFLKTNNQTFHKVKIDFNKYKNPAKLNFSVNLGSIDLNKYEKLKKIGSGGFGSVYEIKEKETQVIYAAKISIYEVDQCSNDVIINLSREIDIISKLNHPSILKFIGFSSRNFKNKQKPTIISEYAPNFSLDKIIENERLGIGNHEWNDTKKLINIYGIASGMAYLHSLDILHRDLKPANILLDNFLYPKIADFGLSKTIFEEDKRELYREKKVITSGFKGTYAYCAPEIIFKQKYTKAGDVYAFGMVVYEIITDEILFQGFNQFQLIRYIMKGEHPKFNYPIPYCYQKLIKKCWDMDFNSRPKFSEIINLLERNPKFITPNVDKEEYFNYISLIKDIQKEKAGSNLTVNFASCCLMSTKTAKVKIKITENDKDESDYFNDHFLNLSKFGRRELISKNDCSKLYKFVEIETNHLYAGQMSMIKIRHLSKSDIDQLTYEIGNIMRMNHPCLLKFIGYSPIDFKKQRKPVIVTEYFSNRSLSDVLEIERNNKFIQGWNETKKLINIFGIASGMSYLHSQGIIHKSLKTCNIYLDDILTPKLGDFGLSTRFNASESITYQSISGIKASPIYSSPEVMQKNEFSKASDVYAFAFIVYEIVCKEIPFKEISNNNLIYNEVVNNNNRPIIHEWVPEVYRKLIEVCWSQEAIKRPSFEEIVFHLKNDPRFITDTVNAENFHQYINFIENQQKDEFNKIIETEQIDENEYNIQKEEIKLASETLEHLAKKYIITNDTENIHRIFRALINKAKYAIPLNYAIELYNKKYYDQSFHFFSLLLKCNHPIAKYYIGIMKFKGQGCESNKKESYNILKYLSDHGIDRATTFLNQHYVNI